MIKVGDRVIIHKPDDVSEFPNWIPDMNKYNGAIIIVEEMEEYDKGTIIRYEGWNFSINWCENLETQASQSPTIDLKVLNSAPSAVKCAACGGGLKEPYPRIKFCPRCEK